MTSFPLENAFFLPSSIQPAFENVPLGADG